MILVFGSADEPPVALVLEALQARGDPHRLVEPGTLDRDGLQFGPGNAGLPSSLRVAGEHLPLAAIDSVYVRPLLPQRRRWDTPQAAQHAGVAFEAFVAWLDTADAFVVSRPHAMNSNNSKPMQAQWIGAAGFEVPETLVTNSVDEARAFWREHRRVVYKSISGVRSIVQELEPVSADRLALLANLPVQLQQWIEGLDVRVHVVGAQCFAAEIHSGATDYRYAHGAEAARLQPHTLPASVASRCVALAQALELPLAGIDLRRRPDGGYVCFEVNPMPAYSYYESNTGLPISMALAQLLADPPASSRPACRQSTT